MEYLLLFYFCLSKKGVRPVPLVVYGVRSTPGRAAGGQKQVMHAANAAVARFYFSRGEGKWRCRKLAGICRL